MRYSRPLSMLVILGLLGSASAAQAQSKSPYDRQTVALIPVSLTPSLGKAMTDLCATGCAGSRWAERFFSQGILSTRLSGDATLITIDADSVLPARLAAEGQAREMILRHFLAQDDFIWRLDSLKARSEYALSASEAQSLVLGANIPDAPIYRTVPSSYIYVVSSADESVGSGTDMLGKPTYVAKASVSAAIYKLGFKSVDELKESVRPFFCDAKCADRDAKRAAWGRYQPPVELVGTITATPSASVSQSESQDAAWRALAIKTLDELIDEGASKYPELAVKAKIIATGPAAAKIGTKEGVVRGLRFYVYAEENDPATGEQTRKRTAVVVASKVANNSVNMISRDVVTASVTATDSTVFKKIYPGSIEQGMYVVEKPSVMAVRVALGAGAGVGALGEARFESLLAGLGMPLGLKPLVGAKFFVKDENGEKYRTTTYGAGIGYELLLGGGRISLMPLAMYTTGKTAPLTCTSEVCEYDVAGADFGVDLGLKLTPEFELSFGLRKVKTYTPVDGLTSANLISIGARLSRGRFGLL